MTKMFGADTDELRNVAGDVSRHSERVSAAESTITPEVSRTDYWYGPDADAFRSAWESVTASNIRALAARLDEINDVLIRQAAEQDEASSATGGVSVGGALSARGFAGAAASDGAEVASGGGLAAGGAAGQGAAAEDDFNKAIEEALKDPKYHSSPMQDGDAQGEGEGMTAEMAARYFESTMPGEWFADLWARTDFSEAEKQKLLNEHPELLRNTDGIPLNVRAEANRLWARNNLEGMKNLYGADSETVNVLQQIADGDLKAVYLDPPRDIIAMYGKLSEDTERVVIHNPQTGGKFEEFAVGTGKGGYLGIPQHLHANDEKGTVVLVYQKGPWAQSIGNVPLTDSIPRFDEGPPYANDPRIYDYLGAELADFQKEGLLTDSCLQGEKEPGRPGGVKMVGMGYSFGNSVTTASEMHGARYDTVISNAGANLPEGWYPISGTKYVPFEYENDLLNVANVMDDRLTERHGIDLYPGQDLDKHPAWQEHARTYPAIRASESWVPPWVERGLGYDPADIAEAHKRAGTYSGDPKDLNRYYYEDLQEEVYS